MKHICPDFNVLARCNAVVNDLLVPIRLDANGNIDCFTLKCFSAQRKVCRIQIDAEKLVARNKQLAEQLVSDVALERQEYLDKS